MIKETTSVETTIMETIKYLPDDIKRIILAYISPLILVFVNKYYYCKYHKIYILNKYNAYFIENGTTHQSSHVSHKRSYNATLKNNIRVNNNFTFSKTVIKMISESIRKNYTFLLGALFNDGAMVVYKIDRYLEENDAFSKWLDLKITDGSNKIYYKALYPYMKMLCKLHNPSIDICNIIDMYYFTYIIKTNDYETPVLMPMLSDGIDEESVELSAMCNKKGRIVKNQYKKMSNAKTSVKNQLWGNI
jgi:hypothetical protein